MGDKNLGKPYWLKKGTMLVERYCIENVVEEGGFGIVYMGWDELLRTKVSIKEYFPRELAGRDRGTEEVSVYQGEAEAIFESGLEKFLNEARVMAAFQHLDGIVWVRDFFFANHTAYIIMEYVEGRNVKECVEKYGRMAPERVLNIMQPVLKSLEQIHQKGLIHRDVSPENIVINQEGNAYLVDFGITRPYTGHDFKTITVFFKRGYAAEEQYREKGKQGPWTDIYGVCATMYYMLTGVTPEESAQRNIKDTLLPLTAYSDINLPDYVKKAIRKGMAVEASKRYATVQQLYCALYEENKRTAGKGKKVITLIGGFAGIILLGSIGILFLQKSPGKTSLLDNRLISEQRVKRSSEELQGIVENTASEPPETIKASQEAEVIDDTPIPEKLFIIPNVQGKTEGKAKSIIKKSNSSLTITVRRVYHSDIKKGKVIRQSLQASTKYKKGEIKKIVITVSKGKKVVKIKKLTVTPIPVRTPVPEPAQQPNSVKKKTGDDYAGTLPY